jgi:hypothetical protein
VSAAETLRLAPGPEADLARRVRELSTELDAERAERIQATEALAEANRVQAVLERDRSVAGAEAIEARRQLDQERLERAVLETRIEAVLSERDQALAGMGWWSRRRHQRRTAGRNTHSAG